MLRKSTLEVTSCDFKLRDALRRKNQLTASARRVAVFGKDAFYQGPKFGIGAFFLRPVEESVFVDGVDKFAGDGS